MSTLQIKQKVTKEAFHKKKALKKKNVIILKKTYSEGEKSLQFMGLLVELLKLKKNLAKVSTSLISGAAKSLRLQAFYKKADFLLKPSSTVAGFKKAMYNSVKYDQNQLQPGYNRRKFNYSHYNQTIKENTRLSKVYANLSTAQLANYRSFVGLNKSSDFSLQLKHLNSNYNQHRKKLNCLLDHVYNKTNNTALAENSPCEIFSANEKTKEIEYTYSDSAAQRISRHIKSPRTIPKMVNLLESRLDVILWRSLFSGSIGSSRQRIREGVLVNGGIQNKASFITLPADVITFTK